MRKRSSPGFIEFAGVSLERIWQLAPSPHASHDYIPQANDLQKVFDLICRLKLDIIDPTTVAEAFRFDARQASYYIEAARELGLLERFSADSYRLSEIGTRMRESPEQTALTLFAGAVIGVPVILRLLGAIRDSAVHHLDKSQFKDIVSNFSGGRYTGATLQRRIESVAAWLRWLENNSEFVLPSSPSG